VGEVVGVGRVGAGNTNKFEIRNSKLQTNPKSQIQNSKRLGFRI